MRHRIKLALAALAVLAVFAAVGCGSTTSASEQQRDRIKTERAISRISKEQAQEEVGKTDRTPCEQLTQSARVTPQSCKKTAKEAAESNPETIREAEAAIQRAEDATGESAKEAAERQRATPQGESATKAASREDEAIRDGQRLQSERKTP